MVSLKDVVIAVQDKNRIATAEVTDRESAHRCAAGFDDETSPAADPDAIDLD
jgi:hypothetical protein